MKQSDKSAKSTTCYKTTHLNLFHCSLWPSNNKLYGRIIISI